MSIQEYDYVIVGAGLAGCLVASRIASGTHSSVLLVEAGPAATDPRIGVPARWLELCGSTLDRSYRTVPQRGLDGRRLTWPRGRVVGGSAAINAMVYVRGHESDYVAWEKAAGPDWGADRVLAALADVERGGVVPGEPLPREKTADLHPFCAAFLAAAAEVGHRSPPLFTPQDMEGVGAYEITRRDGGRWNTTAYLDGAGGSLTVLTDAQATRLTLDGTRVTGVELEVGGERREVRARREVVLSGGAVESPALLLRSGIGPADHLHEIGIDVRHDLPGVGQNLHDHVQVSLGFRATSPHPVADSSNLGEVGGFVATRPGLPAPDVQLSFAPMIGLNGPVESGAGFTVGPAVTRPTSRGSLTLAPDGSPLVDPAYLTTREDVDTLVAGTRAALEIAMAGPLRSLMADDRTLPDALRTTADVEAFVRAHAQTQYHPVGSTAMGTDALAVVDPALRVHGLGGLRVVDAGVIPTMTTGNIQAPVLAVAHIGSTLILEEHHA